MPRTYRNKDKERAQLGIPFTTASLRLHRMIMFSLAQQCGRDDCFRCGKKIETVEEFSIEHKISWLDVSPELFWDLNNIDFSHLDCNRRAGRKPTEWSKEAKEGYLRKKLVRQAVAEQSEELPATAKHGTVEDAERVSV
jgi:HNH endonuclease